MTDNALPASTPTMPGQLKAPDAAMGGRLSFLETRVANVEAAVMVGFHFGKA